MADDVVIRQATSDDAPGIALLHVAIDDDQAIGFAAAGKARDDRLLCGGELYALYLLPERQRQGLGRRLFEAARTALHDQGHPTMMLWVLADNPARAFYEHLGGQRIATRQRDLRRQGPRGNRL